MTRVAWSFIPCSGSIPNSIKKDQRRLQYPVHRHRCGFPPVLEIFGQRYRQEHLVFLVQSLPPGRRGWQQRPLPPKCEPLLQPLPTLLRILNSFSCILRLLSSGILQNSAEKNPRLWPNSNLHSTILLAFCATLFGKELLKRCIDAIQTKVTATTRIIDTTNPGMMG